MSSDLASLSGSLPVTSWSLVAAAGDQVAAGHRQSLAELLRRYLPAIRVHLLRKGFPAASVDDLVQSFIADGILEKQILASADRTRGKFRTFLLTALDRHVHNLERNRRARKRSPRRCDSLDAAADCPDRRACTADRAFEIEWAQQVVAEALSRMQRQCLSGARPELWGIFDVRVRSPLLEGRRPLPYQQLARQFRLSSPVQAANLVITAKRMFRRILREVVSEYAGGDAEADQEIAELVSLLSGR